MPDALTAVRFAYVAVYAAVFLIDLRTGLIPNLITYPAIVASLLVRPDGLGPPPAGNLLAGAAAALFFLAFAWRGLMGMGDVKLVLLIGLSSGPVLTVLALWLGFVSGGLVAIGLLLFGLKRRRDPMPFGPFLALGAATALLYGTELLELSGLGVLFGI